jgi:RNA polymerase sigma-70 factor (ECF subfamily)
MARIYDPETPDVDLLASAVEGEPDAFGEIFRRHCDKVYNHCFRRLGSWTVAEDAMSLVFLETWRRRAAAIDVDGSLLPWLLGVANNVSRNVDRAARRYDSALYRLPSSAAEPDHADDVAARADDERLVQEALRRLRALPRIEQDVLALTVLSGLSYAQAAVALDVPIGTVRSRLARARKRLGQLEAEPSPARASILPHGF